MISNLPAVIQKILSRKNLTESTEIENFLFPRLDQLPKPLEMKNISKAVEILLKGIENSTDIIIWGDYDVDGTTGTALLVNFFREIGVEVHWHIPNRLKDGYGVHSSSFKEIHASLNCTDFILITVDCGISNKVEIEEILQVGGKVIVTDHHQLPIGDVPGCTILNPNQEGCGFREFKLAGVGVAFYLAAAIRTALDEAGYFLGLKKPNMKEYLGFVALGTISDLVELTPPNRVLVRAGMEALSKSNIAGLKSLLESAGLGSGPLTSEDISFTLGPRINAAGRLGAADVAVDLMTCDNISSGHDLSRKLNMYNEKRKVLCDENLETALTIIRSENHLESSAVVVAGGFHSGVIGIVASRIVEIYRKPTIVFAKETLADDRQVLKGSGRSIEGIDLLECLHSSSEHILRYGGHAMAAGLTIFQETFPSFMKTFERQVELACLNIIQGGKGYGLSIECSVDEVMDEETLKYLLKLEPFGPDNEKPVFVDKNAIIVNCRPIGCNCQHLQLTVRGKYANYRAVAFGLGNRYDDVKKNSTREISFTPMVNRFRGTVDWQLRVIDL